MKTTKLIVDMNRMDEKNLTAHERLTKLLETFFVQLEKDKLFFQFSLNMMTQPNTRQVLSDLIKERSLFILESTKSIFKEIYSEQVETMSYLFIAELDGIALNYLGVYEDYPLEQIKKHLIQKYAKECTL